jgi:transketolase
VATRKASGSCLNAVASTLPGMLVGAADLTGNTGTMLDDGQPQAADNPGGRQIHFGIREHAMGAVMNGMSKHGGILPVGGTFFVFSDYMRPAVRLAALSSVKVIYSWTHDSIGLGEDGPTHQPVEQLASLRAMPGLRLIRPADANETAAAWRVAVESPGPTGLVLTRPGVPVLVGPAGHDGVRRGAYVLVEEGDTGGEGPDLVLIGTGSEVSLCVEAARVLGLDGVQARVVSMPSWDLFDEQSETYQEEVLPSEVPTLAVEAGATFGWDRWADDALGLDRFGASAPGEVAMAELGFTTDNVVARARQLLSDLSPEN